MAKWLIIAALVTIGVTALLISVLYRANKPMLDRAKRDRGGEGGYVAPTSTSDRRDADLDNASNDGGSDGGGDGGGGGD